MKEQINKLMHAHDELMKVHIAGAETITFANAMVEMTQAINELQAKYEQAEQTGSTEGQERATNE